MSAVAFTMKQYAQNGLEVHRQVATTLARLIVVVYCCPA
jgi:hypothetical protein